MITGFYQRISFAQIEDGSSNTLVLGEKRLQPSLYDIGDDDDDRGWTGGWDFDILRSTACLIGPDEDINGIPGKESEVESSNYRFGSAHTAVMNTGFADGSVHPIDFEIDLEVLNALGHRADGETIDVNSL